MSAESVEGRVLSISTERLDGLTIRIRVAGEVDLATASQLRSALLAAVETAAPPVEIVVDVAGVRFIDAIGIGVLICGRNAALPSGVGYCVRNPNGVVGRVIDILGLAETLRVVR